jgi:iron-sulfur cluster assembly protein
MKLFLVVQSTLLGFAAVALFPDPASILLSAFLPTVDAFSTSSILSRTINSRTVAPQTTSGTKKTTLSSPQSFATQLCSAAEDVSVTAATDGEEEEIIDYEIPEDAVINIKPKAMKRLRELRAKQKDKDSFMVLRMGVRNGGCSGLSYVMDFSTEEDIQEDDEIDEYTAEYLKCVVDAKSMLYLYGLELDYSEELIGGGFKFFNPNAEESCGCGSSFGV